MPSGTRKRSDSGLLGVLRDRIRRRPSDLMLAESSLHATTEESSPGSPHRATRKSNNGDTGSTPSSPEASPLDKFLSMMDKHFDLTKAQRRRGVVFDQGVNLDPDKSTDDKDDFDVDAVHVGYQELMWFSHVNGDQLHPYGKDAVYMQNYNPSSLVNDRHFFDLLKRLNVNNSPSFHDYGDNPPLNILDLGCGEGNWVLEAATFWEQFGTKVTGFDIVDIIRKFPYVPDNVTWKRGNFVLYDLPYEDDTFDYVRIANLTLCVPLDKWQHVIKESYRVLIPGGRIEIIDDQIFFPYASYIRDAISAPKSPHARDRNVSEVSITSSSTPSTPPLSRSSSSSESSSDDVPITPLNEAIINGPINPNDCIAASESIKDLSSLVDCHVLESLFESMLFKKFLVYLRPHNVFPSLLERIFGPESKAKKIRSLHLSLPEPELQNAPPPKSDKPVRNRLRKRSFTMNRLVSSHSKSSGDLVSMTVNEDQDESIVLSNDVSTTCEDHTTSEDSHGSSECRPSISSYPSTTSTSSFNVTTSSVSSSDYDSQLQAKMKPYQPKGLLLYPDTFIPMSRNEIEMHACKNVHILLGCKTALKEYISTFVDEEGNRLIGDEKWEEAIWRYECLRRRRFNLADNLNMDFDDDDDENVNAPIPSKKFRIPFPKRDRSNSEGESVYNFSAGTTIRAIRVFEAYKPEIEDNY